MIANLACEESFSVHSATAMIVESEQPPALSERSPCNTRVLQVLGIGGQSLATISIDESMTVLDGKRSVEQSTSVPFLEQFWILPGRLLEDDQSLANLYVGIDDDLVVIMIRESLEDVISRHTEGLSSACAERRERACQALEAIGARANGQATSILGMLSSETCSSVFQAACFALAALLGGSMSGSLQQAWLTALKKSQNRPACTARSYSLRNGWRLVRTHSCRSSEQVTLALLAAHSTEWMRPGCCPNVWDHLNSAGVVDRSGLMASAVRSLVAT